jgi:hypothetical protein
MEVTRKALLVLLGAVLATPILAQNEPRPGMRLTSETIKTFLENLGYTPEVPSKPDLPYYIKLRVNDTLFPVAVTLSESQSVLWLFTVSPQLDSEVLTGELALRLLQANNASAPAYFTYSREAKRLGLRLAFTNGGITPVYFRAQLEHFSRLLNETSTIWTSGKWSSANGSTARSK